MHIVLIPPKSLPRFPSDGYDEATGKKMGPLNYKHEVQHLSLNLALGETGLPLGEEVHWVISLLTSDTPGPLRPQLFGGENGIGPIICFLQ